MAGIQASTGLISGVAITDTVDQLMKIAAAPRDRLTTLNQTLQNKQLAIGQLTALVIGVQLSTDQLGKTTLFSQNKVQSSSSSLTATAGTSPQVGHYQFVPIQLAQQQQYTSSAISSADQLVGAGEIDVHVGGFLDDSVALDTLNGGQGISRGQIRITDRSGASATVDLRYAHTARDVVDAINATSDIRVSAKLDGDRFTLTDSSGGSGSVSVTEVGTGVTARDLGLAGVTSSGNLLTGSDVVSISRATSLRSLLDGRGVQFGPSTSASLRFALRDGTTVDFKSTLTSNSASVGQLIDAINTAAGGKVQVSINSSGNGLRVEDLTSGSDTFAVSSPTGTLARDLGWDVASSGGVLTGTQLQSGLGDVLLSSLNGGNGLGQLGSLNLTDRSGATASVDLSTAKTIGQVIDLVNSSGIGINARLNDTRTGITLVDTSGGTSTSIAATSSDTTATKLGLGSTTDPAKLVGKSLERQWITENTLLSEWDQGRGLTLNSIRFTNSAGVASAVNFTQTDAPKTIGDLLRTINKSAKGVEAKINETGDGILLVDTAGGGSQLTVADVGSGKTAQQLKIAGTSSALTVGGNSVQGIDGKLDFKVTTDDKDTVSSLVTKLNAADDTLKASVLNLGVGGVRLSVSSAVSGLQGRIALDTSALSLNLTETLKAQDALVSVGGSSQGGGLLVSSASNTFNDLAPGVNITINDASKTVVTVDVTENSDALTKQISTVVDQFNKLKDKLSELTKFDSGNFSTGVLFGSTEALRIDMAFSQLFSGTHFGAGSLRSVAEIGVTFNDSGKLELDKDKLAAAIDRNPDAVKEFFTKADKGFSAKAKIVADSLAATGKGALMQRNQTLQTQIENNNKRINSWTTRLDGQRTRMLTQFYNMETAIAKIQDNLKIINGIQRVNSDGTSG